MKLINKQWRLIFWGLWTLILIHALRKKIPLIGGIIINEKCNLDCKHCKLSNRKKTFDLSYEDIRRGLKVLSDKKARNLVIGGGEPFLWEEKAGCLEDIIQLARKMGFYYVGVYTNGTFPLKLSSDIIFVSLDGLKETHNNLRKKDIFDIVIQNIRTSSHNNICINYTINSLNKDEIEPFCEYISCLSQVRGIFFYFHTPYYAVDELFLNQAEKREILTKIIRLKKRGHRILNSYACLRGVYKNSWARPSKYCYIYAHNRLYQCCRSIGNSQVCADCGYLSYPELQYLAQCRPSAIASALKYLPAKRKKC